jgi:hypothetical protein
MQQSTAADGNGALREALTQIATFAMATQAQM